MSIPSLALRSQAFLHFLDTWQAGLPALLLAAALPVPNRAAIISVDVIEGFCTAGSLASPRVGAIVNPIVRLLTSAWERGLRDILLIQDTHEPDALEFEAWPPHCVRGTNEAEPVAAFKALPFYSHLLQMPKNSISAGLNTGLEAWLATRPKVDTLIVTGDCTDLCTYQLAMHLRLSANARQLTRRVIVPADCAETYDRSVATAQAQGGLPHDADLLHAVFLYHMALNGIEVVKRLDPLSPDPFLPDS
jgi:nicotinamidase-related amidase